MKLRGSHLVALAILAAVSGWMLTGKMIIGGQVDPNAKTITAREATRKNEAFRVRVTDLQPSERLSVLNVRGRTKAESLVSVRAETGGTIESRNVEKGQTVKPGDLLCVIDKGVRKAQLDQALAQVQQATADYEAAKKLVRRGFTTKSKLRQLKSGLDAATAALATAQQEMGRTEVRATVSGTVTEPMAETGDNLSPGGLCVTLMNNDPMLFSGQVSERDIGKLSLGMPSKVQLISGEAVTGKIRYISSIADAKTRTFAIEIEVPNKDGAVRDGMTAQAMIELQPTLAYKVSSNWLTLADNGDIGVRAVDSGNVVQFHPVKILAQGEEVMWVSGLKPGLQVITLGQNYVAAGQEVEPIAAPETGASTNGSDSPAVASK